MRPFAIALGVLASIATILTYLHLDPPWVSKYLPHLTMPTGDAPPAATPETPTQVTPSSAPFAELYAAGYAQARHHDFSMAVEYYKDAVAAPDASDKEHAKAYDALGYAYFRLGDYDDADRALSSALRFDPDAVVPRVNQIKVMCGRAQEAAEVQTAFETLRTAVNSNAFATRELETDKELFARCAYAEVSAR
jgi:tetratricopeptide (TPR) repeat protein